MPKDLSREDLDLELDDIRSQYLGLSLEDVFVMWFLRAQCVESIEAARPCLTCSPNDGGIDAILIDDTYRRVTILQGKLRNGIMQGSESRNDVVGFAQVATHLTGSDETFDAFRDGLADLPKRLVPSARKRVMDDGYDLDMFYVTTGKCSEKIQNDAERECCNSKTHLDKRPRFKVFDGSEVLESLNHYLIGDAPPIPSITLEASPGTDIAYQQALSRGLESWVFMMNGREVGELLNNRGPKLFALNIRGYLGLKTRVNAAMAATLKKEPESFLLRNNGITIVCTEASSRKKGGVSYLELDRPQIINGQQTTYALNAAPRSQAGKADVFVRVIAVKTGDEHDQIVGQIVEATNSQNQIKSSDLRSNDKLQVKLEEELRRRDYFYVRKVGKGVATANFLKGMIKVPMKGLAEAWMAGHDADFLRDQGSEGLFRTENDALYQRVFGRTTPDELLARWWLSRLIKQAARGIPEKAAARNIVNQLIWSEAGEVIRKRSKAFNSACKAGDGGDVQKAVERVIKCGFNDSNVYFRANRGTGQDRLDAGPFFKRRGNFKPFAAYKSSSFDQAIDALEVALAPG
jgi:hypothetical protein